jgi:D-sedoheptulose 7-phosphate isomerase
MTSGITAELLDGGLAEDLATASLAMARRFACGATLASGFGTSGLGIPRRGTRALVRTAAGQETIDATLVAPVSVRDLVLVDAGAHDIAVAFSTSGSSRDLMAALDEARGRRLLTVGFAGYDGGEMARSDVVEYCFVVRSQSVHRIQESQAILGYHLWAATQQAMHKAVDRCVHPDVHNDPSSGPNPNGGTE